MFYVQVDIFEGRFCATPNAIKNVDTLKIINTRASLRYCRIPFMFYNLKYFNFWW